MTEALARELMAEIAKLTAAVASLEARLPPLNGRQRAARAREKRRSNAPPALLVTHPTEEKVTHPVRDASRTKPPPLPVPSPSPSAPTSSSPFIPLPLGKTLRPESEKQDSEPLTREAWAAYSTAYEERYHVRPVRNRVVNGQMANFVGRVGKAEAPLIAAFYLSHNAAKYVGNGHSVGMMTQNAEPLRMQWASRRKITGTAALQQDRTQENFDGWAEHMSEEGRRALVEK